MENNSTSDVFDPKTFINEDFYLVNELSDENIQALHNYLKPTSNKFNYLFIIFFFHTLYLNQSII